MDYRWATAVRHSQGRREDRWLAEDQDAVWLVDRSRPLGRSGTRGRACVLGWSGVRCRVPRDVDSTARLVPRRISPLPLRISSLPLRTTSSSPGEQGPGVAARATRHGSALLRRMESGSAVFAETGVRTGNRSHPVAEVSYS